MDSARTSTSILSASICLPLDDTYALGGATNATFGVCWRLAASSSFSIRPMRSAPCARMVSKRAKAAVSPLMSSCNSVPV
ncbi:hypothetical protein D3C71_1721450 [compost metagenome]